MKYLVTFLIGFMVGLYLPSAYADDVLEFTPPTERVDGSALSVDEISGFTRYCGGEVGVYPTATFFPGVTLPTTSVTLNDLAPGTSYCVMATVDTDGRESSYSNHTTVNVLESYAPRTVEIPLGNTIIIIRTLPEAGTAAQ